MREPLGHERHRQVRPRRRVARLVQPRNVQAIPARLDQGDRQLRGEREGVIGAELHVGVLARAAPLAPALGIAGVLDGLDADGEGDTHALCLVLAVACLLAQWCLWHGVGVMGQAGRSHGGCRLASRPKRV